MWTNLAGNRTFHKSLLVIWLFLLSGILGQQTIFEGVWQLSINPEGAISPVIGLLLVIAHGISAWSAFAASAVESQNSAKTPPKVVFFGIGLALVPFAILLRDDAFVAVISFVPFWSGMIVCLAWIGVSWKTPREPSAAATVVQQGSFAKLLREDVHTEQFFRMLFVTPTEILALLFSEANQLLFRRGPVWLFAVFRDEVDSIEVIDAEQNSPAQLIVILLTLAVLIGSLVAFTS